jgi:amino acid permease
MFSRKNKKINNCEPLKIWFWSFVTVIIICVFSYGFLLRGSIVNIVERQNKENLISSLSSKVSDLEAEYLKSKNNITEDLALSMGFVSNEGQKFVVRSVATPGLSLVTPSR